MGLHIVDARKTVNLQTHVGNAGVVQGATTVSNRTAYSIVGAGE